MFRFFETRIDPFQDHDEAMPPAHLLAFYWRYCQQVWPFLAALMVVALLVSLVEVSILRFVGSIVDMLRASSPQKVLQDHGLTFLLMAGVILVVRPLVSFVHDLLTQQVIAPGMTNLIRWQAHRYVLRQSLSYFANDFAGRIASNIIQTGPSLRESVVQIIDSLWFVVLFAASALVIFAQTDWRLVCPLALWILTYIAALSYFVPRIRRWAEQIAHMRAIVTGRIVDSYTNIQTVKLFAHIEREDAHARDALIDHTLTFQNETRLITLMNTTVSMLNSSLMVATGGLAVWLWTKDAVTIGDIAIASGLAIPPCRAGSCGLRSAFSKISEQFKKGFGRLLGRTLWSIVQMHRRSWRLMAPSGSRRCVSTMVKPGA
jgi:ATP-binding cassette, subfamily B, multidrug efflux pump